MLTGLRAVHPSPIPQGWEKRSMRGSLLANTYQSVMGRGSTIGSVNWMSQGDEFPSVAQRSMSKRGFPDSRWHSTSSEHLKNIRSVCFNARCAYLRLLHIAKQQQILIFYFVSWRPQVYSQLNHDDDISK